MSYIRANSETRIFKVPEKEEREEGIIQNLTYVTCLFLSVLAE